MVIAADAGYALLGGLLVLLCTGRLGTAPSAPRVLGWFERSRAGRLAVAAGWWWIGWHFLVR